MVPMFTCSSQLRLFTVTPEALLWDEGYATPHAARQASIEAAM